MCLQPPRGVAREEVVHIFVCNFLLIEGKNYMCDMMCPQSFLQCVVWFSASAALGLKKDDEQCGRRAIRLQPFMTMTS